MTARQIIRRMLVFVLPPLFGLLAGCTPQETTREHATVAVNPVLRSATLLLAAEGPAAAQGLDLEIKRFTTGKEAMTRMLEGEADFASVAEFAFVGAQFEHPELRIAAVLTRVQANEVLARRDRGIAKPADLRGKSVGVIPDTDAEFFLHGFLLAQGLRPDDVRIVHLAAEQVSSALTEGRVDAVCTWEPHVFNLKQSLGDQVLAWPAQGGQDGYWLLVTREQVLKDRFQAATRLLRAIDQAEQNLNANPAAYRASLHTLTGVPPAQQEATWKDYRFSLSLPQELLVAMEAGVRWRMTAGQSPVQAVPNYIDNIDTAALNAVQPAAVSLIR